MSYRLPLKREQEIRYAIHHHPEWSRIQMWTALEDLWREMMLLRQDLRKTTKALAGCLAQITVSEQGGEDRE